MEIIKHQNPVTRKWLEKLAVFLPGFIESAPLLAQFYKDADLVFHGSTTRGIDDPYSDLDFWFFLPDEEFNRFCKLSETNFFGFELDGKPGHINVERFELFNNQVQSCSMDIISELRRAYIMGGNGRRAGGLIKRAGKPMRNEVQYAFTFHHYVNMRSWHRSFDNPLARGDHFASLTALMETLGEAMRTASILGGEPYSYDKWLFQDTLETEIGKTLHPHIDEILHLISSGSIKNHIPDVPNPIEHELLEIRKILKEEAISRGIDEPWLTTWWRYLGPWRECLKGLTW